MRLVDIESKEFLEKIELNFGPTVRPLLKKILSEAPIVDAVPVVRCAECRRCFVKETIRYKQPMWLCMRDDLNVCVHPHDFCSYGKRRSE
jgi:hypothetical protein